MMQVGFGIRGKPVLRLLMLSVVCVAAFFIAKAITPDAKLMGPFLLAAPLYIAGMFALGFANKVFGADSPDKYPQSDALTEQAAELGGKLRKKPIVRIYQKPGYESMSAAVGGVIYINESHFEPLDADEQKFVLAAGIANLEAQQKRSWLSWQVLAYLTFGVWAAIHLWAVLVAYVVAGLWLLRGFRKIRKAGGVDAEIDKRAVEITGDLESGLKYLSRRAKTLPSRADQLNARLEALKNTA